MNQHHGADNDTISIFLDVGAETMIRILREVGEGTSTYFLITHVAPNINVSPLMRRCVSARANKNKDQTTNTGARGFRQP